MRKAIWKRAHLVNNQEGALLVMIMVFLALFGVFMALLLSFAEVNLRTTGTVRGTNARTYNADSGVEYAIDALTGDSYETCPEIGDVGSLDPPPGFDPNGRAITVECETLDGGLGFGIHSIDRPAIITTSVGPDSIATQGAAHQIVIATGPKTGKPAIYNSGGFGLGPGAPKLVVKGGGVIQNPPECLKSGQPGKLEVEPPYTYECKAPPPAATDFIDARLLDSAGNYALPATPPDKAPLHVTASGCRTFFPGKYEETGPAILQGSGANPGHNYFASGVYYLNDVGTWSIKNAIVFGGQPQAPESKSLSKTPCVENDEGLESRGANGFGVQIILSGDSRISVGNNSFIELFTRYESEGAPDDPTIYAVRTTAPPASLPAWQPGGVAVDIADQQAEVAIRGLTYSYDGPVAVFAASENALAQISGGVVSSTLLSKLSASAVEGNPGVSSPKFRPRPTFRTLRIKATADDGPGGEAPVAIQAIVTINNDNHDDPFAVNVRSWRKCEDSTCS